MANTTWNPSDKSANIVLTGSNLIATSNTTAVGGVHGTDKQVAGKLYWEYTCTTWGSGNDAIGFGGAASTLATGTGNSFVVAAGTIYNQAVSTGLGIGAVSSGSVVCVAVDLGAGLFWFRLGAAGNWNGNSSNNPATGVGGINGGFGGGAFWLYPWASIGVVSGHAVTANFGDTAFTGVVPAGFTSGFPAPGVAGATTMLATQVAIEHWASVAAAVAGTSNVGAMVLA